MTADDDEVREMLKAIYRIIEWSKQRQRGSMLPRSVVRCCAAPVVPSSERTTVISGSLNGDEDGPLGTIEELEESIDENGEPQTMAKIRFNFAAKNNDLRVADNVKRTRR